MEDVPLNITERLEQLKRIKKTGRSAVPAWFDILDAQTFLHASPSNSVVRRRDGAWFRIQHGGQVLEGINPGIPGVLEGSTRSVESSFLRVAKHQPLDAFYAMTPVRRLLHGLLIEVDRRAGGFAADAMRRRIWTLIEEGYYEGNSVFWLCSPETLGFNRGDRWIGIGEMNNPSDVLHPGSVVERGLAELRLQLTQRFLAACGGNAAELPPRKDGL